MCRHRTPKVMVLCLAWLAWGRAGLCADRAVQDLQAAQLFPATTVAYVEFPDPSAAIDLVFDHPLRRQIEQLDAYKRAVADKNYLQYVVGLTFVEFRLGMTWRKAVATVAHGGIYAAFDGKSNAGAVLVRARDERSLASLIDTLRALAREDAAGKGRQDPLRDEDYRGVAMLHSDQGASFVWGPWLGLSNNRDLLKSLIDRGMNASAEALATQPSFIDARAAQQRPATIWAYANLEAIRASGVAAGAFTGKTDNPVSELLVGGLLDSFRKAPYMTASLRLAQEGLGLELALPHRAEWTTPQREYYFGPNGAGSAGPVPHVDQTVFSLTSYRDLAGMWSKAGDLFDANVNDQIAQTESGLSTLFSGKDFGDDILGAMAPRFQIVAARQQYDEGAPKPAIRLPAFALVLEMKEAEMTRREMRRIFQSLVGFLNIVGAMNGQPQLELDSEKFDGGELVTSTYIADPTRDLDGQAKINFNFSPSLAFRDKRMVISSTRGLARQLVAPPGATASEETPGLNTAARLDVGALRAILEDNRQQLVSQNMLAEGRTREEAERQVTGILAAVSLLRDASLRLHAVEGRLSLELQARLAEPK